MALVNPHGKEKKLKPLLLEGDAQKAELEKAKGLTQVKVTSREVGDLIMLGIGGFTPLTGFMGLAGLKLNPVSAVSLITAGGSGCTYRIQ